MGTHKRAAMNKKGMPQALVFGWILGMIILFAGIILLTFLISLEKMEESGAEYGRIVILLAASFAGSTYAARSFGEKRLLICGISGLVLFATLLSVTALFFDGEYQDIPVSAILILAGSGGAVLLGLRNGNKSSGHKTPRRKLYKMYNR